MTDETASVTRYERDEKRVTNAESNAAPHHTTPHHTTKNYSQQDHGTAVRGWQATEGQRSIDPLTALAATIGLLRPEWRHDVIRAVLARTSGSWHDIARRALTVALDPEQRTPLGIENADMRRYDATPVPPSITEQIAAGLLPPRREAS